ncbi:olfactory receptor 4Q3-like [Hemicordylus capensis]|uniref:olfactory receptor 4Q3-like n=1 Tax=Hemicordylus capensis TaxID=884348 RepID=UPI002303C176|nr:olfactory receptor 4Q3-like [Hemicordylus capensis]
MGNSDNNKMKHLCLFIAQKVKLLEKLDSGVSVKRLTEEYGVGKSTIDDLNKQKGPTISINVSTVTEFVFLGLPQFRPIQCLLFVLVLAAYAVVLLGNLLIVVTVYGEPRLFQSPMYFFLTNLSFDISLGSVATPKLLTDLASSSRSITFVCRMVQVFLIHFIGGSEMLLVTLMAYDRYMAICHPLTYMAIMNRPFCIKLLLSCWAGGLIHATIQMALLLQLPFCGPNELDNFHCDLPQLVKLSCADTYMTETIVVANSGLLSLICFLALMASYGVIVATLRGHFRESGGKALSTCSAHLIVVCISFVPCMFVYLVPFSRSKTDKLASVFYTLIVPSLNPIIYTLRNRDMSEAMGRLKNKCPCSHSSVKGEQI